MTDLKTEAAYEANAVRYSEDWLNQPPPDDMYALLMRHFIAGGRTVDVGCGNGRDAAWLARQGFDVEGYDSSPALIDCEALRHDIEVRYGRVLEGLSRQLRSALHHEPLTGAYEIVVAIIGRD